MMVTDRCHYHLYYYYLLEEYIENYLDIFCIGQLSFSQVQHQRDL